MSKYGCENCKNLKCYPGGRWEPDDYECTKEGPESEELFIRVWENGETWSDSSNPLCPLYSELKEEDFYY